MLGIADVASHRSGASNSTSASARAAGSVLASTGRFGSPRLEPTSAYSGESHSVHEADGLETLLHTRRHLPRPAVEPGDQPFGLQSRQDRSVHAPLPA